MNAELLDNQSALAVINPPLPAFIEAQELKAQVLERAALVGVVKNPEHQNNAVAVLRDVKSLLSSIEKARVKTKEPALELCRKIDKAAKDFSDDLKTEELRINTAIGNYQQEQLEIARRAEAQRQEELRRIEQERIDAAAKAQREREEAERARQAELKRIADAQAAREAEAKRVQEEADRKTLEADLAAKALASAAKNKEQREAAELARKQAEEQQRIAAVEKENQRKILDDLEQANADARARIEADRKAQEEAAAVERVRQEELTAQKMEAVGPQVGTVKAVGQSVKEEFDFQVTDIWLLARAHPGLVRIEENRSEIMAVIKAGMREIKGLRVFPVVKTQVRGAGKVIDIG
jgi:hypothetical protein